MITRTTCRSCGKAIPEFPSEYAYCVECRYHDAPQVKAWDDDDDAPPPPEPVYVEQEDEPEADPSREALARSLAGLLRILTTGSTPLQAGQMACVLAFLLGVSEHRTKASLAKQLKVSPARVSQILAEIPQEFERVTRLKRRSA